MTIEPLSSAMSYQALTVPQMKSMDSGTENKDAAVQEIAKQVDNTTAAVLKTEEKEKDQSMNGKEQQPSNEQIKNAVDKLNKKMMNSEAIFGIHEDTNRVMIKIINKDTKETIKELPPEKTLDMIAKAWELAGLLVDERR